MIKPSAVFLPVSVVILEGEPSLTRFLIALIADAATSIPAAITAPIIPGEVMPLIKPWVVFTPELYALPLAFSEDPASPATAKAAFLTSLILDLIPEANSVVVLAPLELIVYGAT